jgi:hypothetical protein
MDQYKESVKEFFFLHPQETTLTNIYENYDFQTQKRGQMYLIGPKVKIHSLCVFRKCTVIKI